MLYLVVAQHCDDETWALARQITHDPPEDEGTGERKSSRETATEPMACLPSLRRRRRLITCSYDYLTMAAENGRHGRKRRSRAA